jgi:hypothetical protein
MGFFTTIFREGLRFDWWELRYEWDKGESKWNMGFGCCGVGGEFSEDLESWGVVGVGLGLLILIKLAVLIWVWRDI